MNEEWKRRIRDYLERTKNDPRWYAWLKEDIVLDKLFDDEIIIFSKQKCYPMSNKRHIVQDSIAIDVFDLIRDGVELRVEDQNGMLLERKDLMDASYFPNQNVPALWMEEAAERVVLGQPFATFVGEKMVSLSVDEPYRIHRWSDGRVDVVSDTWSVDVLQLNQHMLRYERKKEEEEE